MPTTTTLPPTELVVQHMRRLAKEQPDFTYTRPGYEDGELAPCEYHPTEANPYGCIVGAATRAAADTDRGRYHDLDDTGTYSGMSAVPVFRASAFAWGIGRVQHKQDSGSTWSEAITFLDE